MKIAMLREAQLQPLHDLADRVETRGQDREAALLRHLLCLWDTVCRPVNRCVDPDSATLEHHPDLLRDREDAERWREATRLRPLDDYHEDMGPVLWWRLPIDEPPYCGSPLCSNWPGYHTHFTPVVLPALQATRDGQRSAAITRERWLREVYGDFTPPADPNDDGQGVG